VKELQINLSLQRSDSKRAKVEAVVPQLVRTLILLLNARSLHAAFMISGEENEAWLNADFVPVRSSYFFLVASGCSHDVSRFKDSKWIRVAELCSCTSSWMLTLVLSIWVFSRNLGASVKELKWKRYKRKRSARDHSSSSDGSGSVRHADHSADPAPAGDRARTQEPSSSSAGASAECLSTRLPRGAASSRVGSAGVQQLTSLDLVLQPLVADRQIKRVATAAA